MPYRRFGPQKILERIAAAEEKIFLRQLVLAIRFSLLGPQNGRPIEDALVILCALKEEQSRLGLKLDHSAFDEFGRGANPQTQ